MAKPIRMRDKWRIRWFDENGARCGAVYDDYKLAQQELARKLVEVDDDRRGVRRVPTEKTFADLCDYWLKHKASQKRSGAHDESIIRCHLRGVFGPVVLQRLGVEQVDAFVTSRAHLHPKTVHNIFTIETGGSRSSRTRTRRRHAIARSWTIPSPGS
jgi:hypothetical protein